MKLVKQHQELAIKNFDIDTPRQGCKKHGDLLPTTIRAIFAGSSNCGKTNVLMSLITNKNGLCFENIYVFSKSLNQSKYIMLAEIMKRTPEIGYFTYDSTEKIVPPSEAKKNSIFIFDDVITDSQNHMRDYFSMGRHAGICCFYLAQTYTRIPKHLIRDNANLIVLFTQDELNLKHCYADHVNTDMSFQEFKDICAICWQVKYGFLVINKDCNINNGRYRKGFDIFIDI